MINTIQKFLDATNFRRGTNHPSIETLKVKMEELNINEYLEVEILAYFLY